LTHTPARSHKEGDSSYWGEEEGEREREREEERVKRGRLVAVTLGGVEGR
jgi:hypothetical protein